MQRDVPAGEPVPKVSEQAIQFAARLEKKGDFKGFPWLVFWDACVLARNSQILILRAEIGPERLGDERAGNQNKFPTKCCRGASQRKCHAHFVECRERSQPAG